MNRKKIFFIFLLIAAIAVYFLLFHKDKTLKFIPKNGDSVVLIDVKNFSRQYIYSYATHPSKWFDSEKKEGNTGSLLKSGLKIPDFVQVFHIKDSKFSNWYSVFELKDSQKFSIYLKNQKFINKEQNTFQKDQIFIKIEGEYCIVGTSNLAFKQIGKELFEPNYKSDFNANQFINSSIGSFSLINNDKFTNFSIELNDEAIEIKNTGNSAIFSPIINEIQKNNPFLEVELDEKNVKKAASFYNKSIADSSEISYLKASANIQQVNDTIISYEYDDNFNEIEKLAVQKIIQPNYSVAFQSANPDKTWDFFQNQKWINAQNQFTIIPFQPNIISKNAVGITVESTKKPLKLSKNIKENYIFIKNNPLILQSFSTFTEKEKKMFSTIDYLFYGNKSQDYYLKLKLKKGDLPLILR